MGYKIEIGHGLLKASGGFARAIVGEQPRKLALVSNPKVFHLYGEAVKQSLEESGFEVFVWLMKDGERHKNFRSLEMLLNFLSQNKFTRTDMVVALGGGVVGDLSGFAAAVYLRGVDFLLVPTTLLSMIDSSVGGKTAVNNEFGKNLIGAFHQPKGVLIDVETLKTLPRRELTAGFCEAVKQGVVADYELFDQTADFLKKYSPNHFKKYFSDENFITELENLIRAQVAFKAGIVNQDARESIDRTDGKSRKILNFGHTLAHALEKVTGYKRFKHGEAVGYGILFAAALANELDIFDVNELKSLNDVVHRTGKLPELRDLDADEIFEAFSFDKKQIGDSLQWILPQAIGNPKIISSRDVPTSKIKKTLNRFLQK